MPVRNRINEFLEERGLSVYRFTKDVGISPTTAYALANTPEQLPSSTVLSKICDTYEVQPDKILVWVKPSGQG